MKLELKPPAEPEKLQLKGPDLLPVLPDNIEAGPNKKLQIIGSYLITKTLGQGTFGKVKEGIHLFT